MYLLTKRKPKLTHQGQDLRFEFVRHAVRYNPVDVLFSYASFLAYESFIIVDYDQFHFRSVRRAGRERKPREKMTARVLAARCTRASRPKDFTRPFFLAGYLRSRHRKPKHSISSKNKSVLLFTCVPLPF